MIPQPDTSNRVAKAILAALSPSMLIPIFTNLSHLHSDCKCSLEYTFSHSSLQSHREAALLLPER